MQDTLNAAAKYYFGRGWLINGIGKIGIGKIAYFASCRLDSRQLTA